LQNIKNALNINSKKGAIFSLEATISILCLAMLLTTVNYTEKQSNQELLITQQANDLLRVWSTQYENENTMIEDTKIIFGEKAELYINNKKIFSAAQEKNSISTEGIILNQMLQENTIRIVVYYN